MMPRPSSAGSNNTIRFSPQSQSRTSSDTIRQSDQSVVPPSYNVDDHPEAAATEDHQQQVVDQQRESRAASMGVALNVSRRSQSPMLWAGRGNVEMLEANSISIPKPSDMAVFFHMEQFENIRHGLQLKTALDATRNSETKNHIASVMRDRMDQIKNRGSGHFYHSRSMALGQLQMAKNEGLKGMGYQEATDLQFEAATKLLAEDWSAGQIMTALASFDPKLYKWINADHS